MHRHFRIQRFSLVSVLLVALSLWMNLAGGALAIASQARTALPVNLREAPSTHSLILQILSEGTIMTVSGGDVDGYVPVQVDDQEGWVRSDYVAFVASANMLSSSSAPKLHSRVATTVDVLNLREGPGDEYPQLMEIPPGTAVTILAIRSGSYSKVSVDRKVGWVRSIYLEVDASGSNQYAASAGRGSAPNINLTGRQGNVAAEIVMRSGPDRESAKVDVIPKSSRVKLTGKRQDGFVEVQFKQKTGWIAEDYLNLRHQPDDQGPSQIPVLMYHSIQESPGEYQVMQWQLEEQMKWLSENGYTSITSTDLLHWISFGIPLPQKPVMITVDDGYSTDWDFLDTLDHYGLKGVFFLPNYANLSDQQVRTLERAGEVCGHTVSHPILSTLSYDQQYDEIENNKRYLEDILGRPVTCFAYPFGDYNTITDYAIIDTGYLIAYNAWQTSQPLDDSLNRWHITRINVSGNYTLDDFAAAVEAPA